MLASILKVPQNSLIKYKYKDSFFFFFLRNIDGKEFP